MPTVKNNNYYIISGWMINELQLKGTELQVYAIIYGFSQDGESEFSGSLNYIMSWLGVSSKHTVINALKSLVDKGLVIKEPLTINGVVFNKYRVNPESLGSAKNAPPVQNLTQGSAENAPGVVQKMHRGSAKNAPNNNIYNNINNNIDNIIPIELKPLSKQTYLDAVKLTVQEYDALVNKYGKEKTDGCIEILNNYLCATGKKYKSHYHVILNWVHKRYDEEHKFDRPNTAVEGELLVW